MDRLQRLGLCATSTLIDLGAGTGALALAAALYCRRVVAVDVSPAMLDVVQRRASQLGLTNLECQKAGFLTYQRTGSPTDFVYSRHALHQLPDFWKATALRRIAGILRPGGVLRIRDLFLSCALNELETHLREEHSTFTWLFEPMLAQAGFAISETSYSPSRTLASYTCAVSS